MGTSTVRIGNRVFAVERTLVETTMLHRADPNWVFVDKGGHTHRWHMDEGKYILLNVKQVPDPSYWDEYDGEISVWHYECVECGDTVIPGTKADETPVYQAGIDYTIDGRPVSKETFYAELKKEERGRG